jgi:membrane dipeptidase
MGPKGHELLKEMARLNIILDATHLCDDAFWEALDHFNGYVWASHNNCRALVNHNRQFSDEMIKALIQRGAVIGAALDAWMMVPNWVRGMSTPEGMGCNLEVMIDHIDHICQLAGNTLHVGVGSDLDGAFGREQCPYDLETIADLQKVPVLLRNRGYSQTDIENMMHGNWLRFLRKAWAVNN